MFSLLYQVHMYNVVRSNCSAVKFIFVMPIIFFFSQKDLGSL